MGTITRTGKKMIGAGNFDYTYECVCIPKPLKDIKVTSGNDNEADQLAQMECDEYCKPTNAAQSDATRKQGE